MTNRRTTIKLEAGDIRALRIIRGKHGLRLAVYDEDKAVPIIQARLSEVERQALRKALGSGRDK